VRVRREGLLTVPTGSGQRCIRPGTRTTFTSLGFRKGWKVVLDKTSVFPSIPSIPPFTQKISSSCRTCTPLSVANAASSFHQAAATPYLFSPKTTNTPTRLASCSNLAISRSCLYHPSLYSTLFTRRTSGRCRWSGWEYLFGRNCRSSTTGQLMRPASLRKQRRIS
jgi:hypothetical protein